jgi:lipoprotein-anchoring transpeptidase ErfK/SrfK
MAMRTSKALLPALVVATLISASPTVAQEGWMFEGDRKKAAEQLEAEREARRASAAPVVYPKHMDGGERPDIQPAEPPIVYFDQPEEVGSIIVDTENKRLFYVLPGKKAYQYPISVGRDGFTWSGTERISRIVAWPSWTPPPEMHKRQPGLPITVTGGMKNPQGARALYLGNTIYRIHGTNNDRTVGRANSSGCFRLTNEHVVHLASIAKVGAKVRVLAAYSGGVSETAPMSSLFSLWSSESEKQAAPPPKARPVVKKAAPPVAKTAEPQATGSLPPPQATAAPSAQASRVAQ